MNEVTFGEAPRNGAWFLMTVSYDNALLLPWPFLLKEVEVIVWEWEEILLVSYVKMTHGISKLELGLKYYLY